jgi:hypothetical protein
MVWQGGEPAQPDTALFAELSTTSMCTVLFELKKAPCLLSGEIFFSSPTLVFGEDADSDLYGRGTAIWWVSIPPNVYVV